MGRQRKPYAGIWAAAGMLLLILDARTGFQGAAEGIRLCISSVIPSLFPFFVLSMVLTGTIAGSTWRGLRPLGRLCGLPKGAESLLVVGLMGGYPVGAQSIAQAYRAGSLNGQDARRMLGFCSNAGPAFVFGILGSMFSTPWAAWLLWIIHILSAIAVGIILPGRSSRTAVPTAGQTLSLPAALERSLKVMAGVCGWVVMFRMILAILNRWILWILPENAQIIAAGLLELTNGCFHLPTIEEQGLRFLLASGFLACGGVCVAMQTLSVTGALGLGQYIPGKLLQTGISLVLAGILQNLIFSGTDRCPLLPVLAIPGLFVCGNIIFLRITSRNPKAIGV